MSTPDHTAWVIDGAVIGLFRREFTNPTMRGLRMRVSVGPVPGGTGSPGFCVEEKVEFCTFPTEHETPGPEVFEGMRTRYLSPGHLTEHEAELQAISYLNGFEPGTVAWNGVSVVDPTVTEGWVEVDSMMDAVDTGGDDQVGRAWDRRFRHPEKPGCLMTVALYGVRVDNDAVAAGFELGVCKQTEYMICRDIEAPGDTEVWCDYEYDMLDGYNTLNSVEAAETEAHDWLKKLNAGDLSWDGVKVR